MKPAQFSSAPLVTIHTSGKLLVTAIQCPWIDVRQFLSGTRSTHHWGIRFPNNMGPALVSSLEKSQEGLPNLCKFTTITL